MTVTDVITFLMCLIFAPPVVIWGIHHLSRKNDYGKHLD